VGIVGIAPRPTHFNDGTNYDVVEMVYKAVNDHGFQSHWLEMDV
jgi:hypothetical protein